MADAGRGETGLSISMYEASVGVFVPFLENLSRLLSHASAYAEARKIDPSILLKMRLYPNMYNLTQQVGEANRHAVTASRAFPFRLNRNGGSSFLFWRVFFTRTGTHFAGKRSSGSRSATLRRH